MATLFIAVFETAGSTAIGPPIQEEVVAVGAGSLQSNVIVAGRDRIVRLFTDTDCFVTWGANPTALIDGTEGRPLGLDNPEYFQIPAGDKIAVITRI